MTTQGTDASSPYDRQPLDWISVVGFRSIRSAQKLQMRRTNVVIGANGSGKSNLVGVFSFLAAIRAGKLGEYVARAGGANRILHFGAKTTDKLIIDVSFADDINRYQITLVPDESDWLVPVRESVYYWDKRTHPHPYHDLLFSSADREAGISKDVPTGIPSWIQSRLDRWSLYHFHDTGRHSPFKKACAVHNNRFLRPDGSNLAAFLYLLQEKHHDSYDLIRRTIRLVAPFFDDFVLEPMATNEDMIRLEWRHAGTDSYFDASSLSDGTLRFMAMATLLLQPVHFLPSVILMDEPELGLHPSAITLFCSLVKAASVNVQVIVATQSSLMLDHFEPEDVLVVERRGGASTFRRLDTKNLEAWLHEYSLGQLWEKNEFGGRPMPEIRKTQ